MGGHEDSAIFTKQDNMLYQGFFKEGGLKSTVQNKARKNILYEFFGNVL